jgi:ComF family protein
MSKLVWQEQGRKYFGFLFDLLFPIECFGCGQAGSWLCPACSTETLTLELTRVYLPFCPNVDALWHIADFYDPLVARLVKTAKYQGVRALSVISGQLLTHTVFSSSLGLGFAGLTCTPVPIYPNRLRMRGFNQAELMTQEFVKLSGGHICLCLKKIKNTRPQARLTGQERRQNLYGSLTLVGSEQPLPETILLIDDVLTTGATFEEAARILKLAGVKKVIGLAFAHGI